MTLVLCWFYYYVAEVTLEGVLVNQHLGEAARFQIWGEDDGGGYPHIEDRNAPPAGGGNGCG